MYCNVFCVYSQWGEQRFEGLNFLHSILSIAKLIALFTSLPFRSPRTDSCVGSTQFSNTWRTVDSVLSGESEGSRLPSLPPGHPFRVVFLRRYWNINVHSLFWSSESSTHDMLRRYLAGFFLSILLSSLGCNVPVEILAPSQWPMILPLFSSRAISISFSTSKFAKSPNHDSSFRLTQFRSTFLVMYSMFFSKWDYPSLPAICETPFGDSVLPRQWKSFLSFYCVYSFLCGCTSYPVHFQRVRESVSWDTRR